MVVVGSCGNCYKTSISLGIWNSADLLKAVWVVEGGRGRGKPKPLVPAKWWNDLNKTGICVRLKFCGRKRSSGGLGQETLTTYQAALPEVQILPFLWLEHPRSMI